MRDHSASDWRWSGMSIVVPLTTQRMRIARARFAAAVLEVVSARRDEPESLPLSEGACLLFEQALREAWHEFSIAERTRIKLYIRSDADAGLANEAIWLLEAK